MIQTLIPDPAATAAYTAPASALQEQYWLLNRLNPLSPAYNVASAVRIRGPLDGSALERALRRVVARHDVLRTVLREAGGELTQVVSGSVDVAIEHEDLPGVLPDASADCLAEALRREIGRPFDLAAGPLLRVKLYCLGRTEFLLLVVRHHSIVDLAGEVQFAREWSACYGEEAAGRPADLAGVRQYAEFACWQRAWLQGEEHRRQLASWKQRLARIPDFLELPLDYPRPAAQAGVGSAEAFALRPDLCAGLRRLAGAEGVSLFLTLLAGYCVLLHRYSGQPVVAVGVPFPNRRRPEFRSVMGCCVNILPVVVDFSGDPGFRELVHRVSAATLEAHRTQETPLTAVVQAVRPVRDPSRHPLFQAGFTFRPPMQLDLAGLETTPFPVHNGGAQLDLFATLWEDGDTVGGLLEYDSALFAAATPRRMLRHLETLLASAAANPGLASSRLEILTAEDRRQLAAWNGTQTPYPDGCLLHELFEAQAVRTPNAPAVEFGQQSFTYAELNARANQLAHRLRKLGVRPGALVGVCLERSLDLVVALYAVLKAGGAYVPIDPGYPPARVAFLLEDAAAPVLITTTALLAELPPQNAAVLTLDDGWSAIASEPDSNPVTETQPGDLAYVIYTSGSTGKPKGAMNTHRGICNRLLWMQDRYQLTPGDKVLQKTPFSFDVSVWEFFWPLLAGARLVVAAPGGHQDPAYLVRLIRSRGITVLHFVPPMLQVFLEEPGVAQCRSLRHVICSGEALPYELQERFFQVLGAELHNLYGPTEAAVDVTHWTCVRGGARKIVPIGRPVANTQVHVLDRHLQPVPVGVAGELYIGGVQVGRGYHNRPELTAEKFIPDPFRGEPGATLYRTGDLCRWLADGVVEYLGRIDSQVKIRGLRVELGEIETALNAHPQVGGSAVVAREDAPGGKRLVAYVVGRRSAPPPDAAGLREHLRRQLPGFMVPAAFVFLERFPLLPNGKVDRRALPAPDAAAAARPAGNPPAAAGGLEQAIAAIWNRELGGTEIDLDANFFDLGGDSLRLMRVRAAILHDLGRDVGMTDMFRHPTVRSLAACLAAGASGVANVPDAARNAPPREALRRRLRRIRAAGEGDE